MALLSTFSPLVRPVARPALSLGLGAARLPLHLAERALGHRDDPAWLPTRTFDQAEAAVLAQAGALLHDDRLTARSRLLAAKVDRLETAATLEQRAAEQRARADATRQEREDASRASAEDARREASRLTRNANQRARRRTEAAEARAREQEAEAERARDDAERRIARQERSEQAEALTTERKAIARNRSATTSKKAAATKGRQIDQLQQRRKQTRRARD
jgi:hypothetical protein